MKTFVYRVQRLSRHTFFWAVILVIVMLILMLAALMSAEASGPVKPTDPNDFPGGAGIGATVKAGVAVRLYTLFATVDITNPATGACLSYGKYFDLIKYYYRGWTIVGKPFLQSGRWYLKIQRTVSY